MVILTNRALIIIFAIIIFSCKKDEQKREAKVETKAVSEILATTAKVSGDIIDLGEGITDYGHCWGLTATPTIADSRTSLGAAIKTGVFTSELKALESGKKYYVRAYVQSSEEVDYGTDITFSTLSVPGAPTGVSAVAGNAQAIVTFSAPSNNGGSSITGYTVTSSPGGLKGAGSVSPITINGLTNGTAYTFTVTAINVIGTGPVSSASNSVTPSAPLPTLSDIEGNIYNIVTIGTQVWMAENLKVTKYNDGSTIPNITNNSSWAALSTPGYCFYNNDATTYKATYGILYNWYAVNTGKLCPTGWHIPTDAEWTTLSNYSGGESIAGGKLKEVGTSHWLTPNTGATNESGFTALPGGFNSKDGAYSLIGDSGKWWASNEYSTSSGWYYLLSFSNSNAFISYANMRNGFSIRCLRDF